MQKGSFAGAQHHSQYDGQWLTTVVTHKKKLAVRKVLHPIAHESPIRRRYAYFERLWAVQSQAHAGIVLHFPSQMCPYPLDIPKIVEMSPKKPNGD